MVLTVPNLLTLLRILAVPFFAIAVWYGDMYHATILFFAAGMTDFLDGYVARRFNQKSTLGAILDPAADKLLMTTAFILLAFPREPLLLKIPAWVGILAISRDFLISLVALVAFERLGPSKFQPSLLGKFTTFAQVLALSLTLLINALGLAPWQRYVVPWIFYIVAAGVLGSGLHYFFRATHGSEGA